MAYPHPAPRGLEEVRGEGPYLYEPVELLERLAAPVPPRFNLTKCSGVLAPAAAFRPEIVPREEAPPTVAHAGCRRGVATTKGDSREVNEKCRCRPRNYPWAQLMERVLEFDVFACPRCGAKMRILAAIDVPDTIRQILACLGLRARAPPLEQAYPHTDEATLW